MMQCLASASTSSSSRILFAVPLVRELHASASTFGGGPRPKKPRFPTTSGASRTKLSTNVQSSFPGRTRGKVKGTRDRDSGAYFGDIPGGRERPFSGKGAFGSPYGRAPSVDPRSKELSERELYMRARATVSKISPDRIDGQSVYRDHEWNAEAKRGARFGLKPESRGSPSSSIGSGYGRDERGIRKSPPEFATRPRFADEGRPDPYRPQRRLRSYGHPRQSGLAVSPSVYLEPHPLPPPPPKRKGLKPKPERWTDSQAFASAAAEALRERRPEGVEAAEVGVAAKADTVVGAPKGTVEIFYDSPHTERLREEIARQLSPGPASETRADSINPAFGGRSTKSASTSPSVSETTRTQSREPVSWDLNSTSLHVKSKRTAWHLNPSTSTPFNSSDSTPSTDPPPPRTKGAIPRAFTHTPLINPSRSSADDEVDVQTFEDAPLLEGLVESVYEVLGRDAQPTVIQQLALSHLVHPEETHEEEGFSQTMLASETGSGKTLAYLLPVLHSLKRSELRQAESESEEVRRPSTPRPLTPRALILSPTHELARQISTNAKSLCHIVKLRVLCGSKANKPSTGGPGSRLRDQRELVSGIEGASLDTDDPTATSEFTITRENAVNLGLGPTSSMRHRAVDLFTGTPATILELCRGNGWERQGQTVDVDPYGRGGRTWEVGEPQMGLDKIEWVVIDEADILLDPDFRDHTLAILDDIALARGYLLSDDIRRANAVKVQENATSSIVKSTGVATATGTLPFHLILNSATIPGLLSATVQARWPEMVRLASPGVHKLPETMRTQHVAATGNRLADVAKRIENIWAEDGRKSEHSYGSRLGGANRSKILVFVNRHSKAAELSEYLSANRRIANVLMTGQSGREKHSNKSLAPFLKPTGSASNQSKSDSSSPIRSEDNSADVLITTSLLSRGLDFSEDVRHVLIVDEPRNVVDLLHRAGRSARMGASGTVTVFGKGQEGAREMGRAVRELSV